MSWELYWTGGLSSSIARCVECGSNAGQCVGPPACGPTTMQSGAHAQGSLLGAVWHSGEA